MNDHASSAAMPLVRRWGAAAAIVVTGLAASAAIWRTLPHPGRSGQLLLDLGVFAIAIIVVRLGSRMSVNIRALGLVCVLLVLQMTVQSVVWFGVSPLN